jgi:hypothetical protein
LLASSIGTVEAFRPERFSAGVVRVPVNVGDAVGARLVSVGCT